MNGIFDSIFFPNDFFKKQTTSYVSSFLTFFFVYLINLLSFPEFILRVIGFFGLKSMVLLALCIPVMYFLNFGVDLLFLNSDKNNWVKTHYGHTFSPYIFAPVSIIFILNFNYHTKFMGIVTIISLVLWSAILFFKSTGNMKLFFVKAAKDSLVLYAWIMLLI